MTQHHSVMNESPKIRVATEEKLVDNCRKVLMAFFNNFSHTFSRLSCKITLDIPCDQSNDQLGHTYRVEVQSLHQYPTP